MSIERGIYEEEIARKIKRESDTGLFNHQRGKKQNMMLGPSSIGTLNTITPCAACKLLRRRCAQECPFSPYFSPHEPQKFASVHKVFGASNVSKMLMEVPESQRADAANSLVYEANVRLSDPVYGCMGTISDLQQQVQLLQAELDALKSEIIKYKYREDQADINHNINNNIVLITPSSHFTLLSSGVVPILAPPHPSTPSLPPPPPPPPPPPSLTCSTAASPMYTSASTAATDYRTISNESNSYLG